MHLKPSKLILYLNVAAVRHGDSPENTLDISRRAIFPLCIVALTIYINS
jgi:hypothetical protein